jgi:hypothetical protein
MHIREVRPGAKIGPGFQEFERGLGGPKGHGDSSHGVVPIPAALGNDPSEIGAKSPSEVGQKPNIPGVVLWEGREGRAQPSIYIQPKRGHGIFPQGFENVDRLVKKNGLALSMTEINDLDLRLKAEGHARRFQGPGSLGIKRRVRRTKTDDLPGPSHLGQYSRVFPPRPDF